MVELFPYAERSRGISVEQFFVRGAGFFTTFVNPIGMDGAGWKYLIMYIVMICVEICTIYFFYPETQGRTLEELAFCKFFYIFGLGLMLIFGHSIRGRDPC
jgi:Na+/melibiose symporter-like transporter